MKIRYEIERTSRFKKDYRLIQKRGYDVKLLQDVITILANGIANGIANDGRKGLPEQAHSSALMNLYSSTISV